MPSHIPIMTNAGLLPTKKVFVKDEYNNTRELNIAEERPLTIYIDSYEIVTLMTLGCEPELLALGYIKNQELISNLNEIISVNAAAITTQNKRDDWKDKLGTRIVTTGCGQGTIFHGIMEQLDKLKIKQRKIKQSTLYLLLKHLTAYNDVYKNAGAVHGCALCNELLTYYIGKKLTENNYESKFNIYISKIDNSNIIDKHNIQLIGKVIYKMK